MQECQSSPAGLQPSQGTALLLSMLRRAQSLGRRVEASGLAGEGQGQGPLCMAWGGRLCSSEGRTPLEGSSAAAGAEPCSTSSPSAWSPGEPALGPPLPSLSRILLWGRVPPSSRLGGTRAGEGVAVCTERVSTRWWPWPAARTPQQPPPGLRALGDLTLAECRGCILGTEQPGARGCAGRSVPHTPDAHSPGASAGRESAGLGAARAGCRVLGCAWCFTVPSVCSCSRRH